MPDWFLIVITVVNLVILPICGWALLAILQLRDAVIKLTTKMEHLDGWEHAVDQLQERISEMHSRGSHYSINAITKLERSDEEQWRVIRKLEKYVHGLRSRESKRDSDSDVDIGGQM